MKKILSIGLCLATSLPALAQTDTESGYIADRKGLRYDSQPLSLRLNGALLLDGDYRDGLYQQTDPLVAAKEAWETELRRAELSFRMKFMGWGYAKYKFNVTDDGELETRDAYLGVRLGDKFRVQAGRMKQPFGLERSISVKNQMMIERSLAGTALAPRRAEGIKIAFGGERLNWGAGVFQRDIKDSNEKDESISTRITWDILNDKSNHWHIGGSYISHNYNDTMQRIRTRAEVHTASKFLKSKKMLAEDQTVMALESSFTYNNWLLQGEYYIGDMTSKSDQIEYKDIDQEHRGYYIQAAYTFNKRGHKYKKAKLTGYDSYKREKGASDGDRIAKGSWELVARYSALDAYDSVEDNGFAAVSTSVGVNYYFGHYLRLMGNLIETDVTEGKYADLPARAATMRLQLQF